MPTLGGPVVVFYLKSGCSWHAPTQRPDGKSRAMRPRFANACGNIGCAAAVAAFGRREPDAENRYASRDALGAGPRLASVRSRPPSYMPPRTARGANAEAQAAECWARGRTTQIEVEPSVQLTSQPLRSSSRLHRSSLGSSMACQCNSAGNATLGINLQNAVDFRVERASPSRADPLDRRRA